MFHWPEVTLPLRNLRSMKLVLLLFYIQVCNTSALWNWVLFQIYISGLWNLESVNHPPSRDPNKSEHGLHTSIGMVTCMYWTPRDPSKSKHNLHPSNGMAPCTYWTYFQGLFESNQSKYTHSETVLVLFNRLAICCGKVVISRRWHQLWITTSLKTSLTAKLALNWRQMKATRLT